MTMNEFFKSNPQILIHVDLNGELRIKLSGDKAECAMMLALVTLVAPDVSQLLEMTDYCLDECRDELDNIVKAFSKPRDKKHLRN